MNIAMPAFFAPVGFGQPPDWGPIYTANPTVKIAVLGIDLDTIDPKVAFSIFSAKLGPWANDAPALVTQAHMNVPAMLVLGYVPTDDATAATGAPTLDGKPKVALRTQADIE